MAARASKITMHIDNRGFDEALAESVRSFALQWAKDHISFTREEEDVD